MTYSGNTVIMVTKSGGTIVDKQVMTTNDKNQLLRMETRDLNSDTIRYYSEFQYNGNGELLKAVSVNGTSSPYISTADYTDGNLTSINNSGDVTSLAYYTDQKYRVGDYYQVIQAISTGSSHYILNKNLIKSSTTRGSIANFNYTFGENNRITKLEILNGAEYYNARYHSGVRLEFVLIACLMFEKFVIVN